MTASQKPMAFYHEDGLVPAWNFAKRYAGNNGRIATLPDLIEARLASQPGDLAWERYFTTNTAEYLGKGADGREKLIVAHGVGPMSTIEGIKHAYSWQYRDKDRNRRGGRISSEEFLKLEAGEYGQAAVLRSPYDLATLDQQKQYPVFVIDFRDYVAVAGQYPFRQHHTSSDAWGDMLVFARLGLRARDYITNHREHAEAWHAEHGYEFDQAVGPYIIFNEDASNCPYTTYARIDGRFDWSTPLPWPLEDGKAMAHLITMSGLSHTSFSDDYGYWQGLITEILCHEWSNGVRFLALPETVSWDTGIAESPQPHDVLRQRWRELMQPVSSGSHVPPRLYRIEQSGGEWFTRYPKPSDGQRMDESDIEFHVRSVQAILETRTFTVDEYFFLRYSLSQVVALAPPNANAYDIVNVTGKDRDGLTTVVVQFYDADVDTSQRLPRVKDIKQNYDLLMK